tara:strand:- start:898 stop:2109 length:1212 start_codon:yes stop_codon:yes gene_type:complete
MEIEKLNSLYDSLIKDDDFDKLELGLNEPNIFQILRISRKEIRHSNFLSWLLNPNSNHGLSDILLRSFLTEVFLSQKVVQRNELETRKLDLNNVEIRREWKFIDLLIVLDDFVVCVENKIFSSEHSDQLKRYKEIIEKEFPDKDKVFVYLTPFGVLPEQESETYIPISYQSIIEILEGIDEKQFDSINPSVRNYIDDYIITLKRDVMGNDKLTELSKKIYNNHKELFDFVYERKFQINDVVNTLLREVLESKGYIIGSLGKVYVRFTTKEIKELTYYNSMSNGWSLGESFLFEFQLSPDRNVILFKSVISPCDLNYNRKRLHDIILGIDGGNPGKGKQWITNHSSNYKFNFELIDEKSEEELTNELTLIVEDVIEVVNKYEKEFLNHKDELLKMKSISSSTQP